MYNIITIISLTQVQICHTKARGLPKTGTGSQLFLNGGRQKLHFFKKKGRPFDRRSKLYIVYIDSAQFSQNQTFLYRIY
jgi:hypothetical protein